MKFGHNLKKMAENLGKICFAACTTIIANQNILLLEMFPTHPAGLYGTCANYYINDIVC